MIKIEKVEISGWRAAMRGMRNAMNSWDKADTDDCRQLFDSDCPMDCPQYSSCNRGNIQPLIGPNDLKLAKSLVLAGSDHSKFMRFIDVTLDITAPMYLWKELDTYKVGTVRNSCSTMHKIHDKEFTLEDFSHEHLLTKEEVEWGGRITRTTLEMVINALNEYRKKYIATKDKQYWWQMIQLLPSSYNQRATIKLNYTVLRNMYFARKNHKLDEWRTFCKWIESLPYSELITATKDKDVKEVVSDVSLEGIDGYILEFESSAEELRNVDCGELAEHKQKVADWLKDYMRLRKEMSNGK